MNYSRNNSNARKIEKMDKATKHAYLASGRVTVDHVCLAVDAPNGGKSLKTFYVAKIRGVVVGNSGETTFDTPEAAKAHGQRILAIWKAQS